PTPTPTLPGAEPHAPSLAFSPPPAPAAETGGGPDNGEVPGAAGQPGYGGHTAAPTLEEGDAGDGGGGPGKGIGHIKAKGKGHDGGSPGKGHEKDQGGEVVVESGPGESGGPDDHSGGHGRGQGKGKGRGGGPPAAPPAAPAPPPPEPGPGSKGSSGKGEGPGNGKSTA